MAFKDDVFIREQYQEPYSRVMISTKIIADYNLAEFLTTIAFAGVWLRSKSGNIVYAWDIPT